MRHSRFDRLARSFLMASLLLPALAPPASAHTLMMPPHGFSGALHSHSGATPGLRHQWPRATGFGGAGWDSTPSSSSAETFSPTVTVYNVSYPDLVRPGGDCVILKLDYDGKGRFVGTRRINAC